MAGCNSCKHLDPKGSKPGSSVWAGLSTAADSTPEYTSVGDYNTGAAYSTSTKLYTVYTFNVNYEAGQNVSEVGETSATCKVNAKGSQAGGTSCTVTLPTITPESGYVSAGWNTTEGATTGTAAGASYSIINKNYVTGINTTSGIYNMTWYGGNMNGASQDGQPQTQVFGWGMHSI